MKTKVENIGTIAVVKPRGRLQGGDETIDLLETVRKLATGGNTQLVVDMANVDYLSSRGISALLEIHDNYSKRNAVMKVCNIDKIQNVFVVTQLVKTLTITTSCASAIASFQEG